MSKVKVSGIRWEADDMEDVADVPTELVIEVPEDFLNEDDIENYIEDEISNVSGFTHNGWDDYAILDD